MRRLLCGVALSGVLLAVTACSGDDDSDSAPHRSTTSDGSSGATTSSTSTTVASEPPDVATQPEPTAAPGYDNVGEGDGWRLEVLQPAADASIGSSTTLCTMVSGRSREAAVVMDVTLLDAGSSSDGISTQVESDVGRVPVLVSFPDASSGPHDLRVQLSINGRQIDGAVVTVPSVVVSEGADTTETTCS